MTKIKTLEDLRRMKNELQGKISLREKSDSPESLVQVKISMSTCGIASGAKEIMNYFIDELDNRNISALVTQTGCMGYSYAEPTIEVTLPGKMPLVYGDVDTKKASEIIEKYILSGKMVDGIIPDSYKSSSNE